MSQKKLNNIKKAKENKRALETEDLKMSFSKSLSQ